MLKKISIALVACLLTSFNLLAQTGIIKGFVYDKANGEPMIYNTVFLSETPYGTQTDLNGYFSISGIPEGSYTLMTTSLGYDTATVSIVIKAGDVHNKKLFIGKSERTLTTVEVSARKKEKLTNPNVGLTRITPKEIKLLPSAGGEPDITQFLQVTPGVIFTGDQGGQLFIRGGSPSQTGILLDGITIYNPFHSIGLYSVFETDAIRSADIYTAGFGAQYGNRTSAILDIRTKDGNSNRLSGKISGSPIMGRVMLEGPLVKSKVQGGSNVTFLVNAKHSYLNETSKAIYGGFGEPFKTGLPYNFTDLYGKVSFNATNGSKLNLFGFNFTDKAGMISPGAIQRSADFDWYTRGGGATFVVSPAASSTLIGGKFAYSTYQMNFKEAIQELPRKTGIEGFEAGIDITNFLPKNSVFKYGLEVSGQHSTLSFRNSFKAMTTLDRRNTSAAIFADFRKNFGDKLVLEPSVRFQYYSNISKLSPEPRLSLKYNIAPDIRFKAATGYYTQNIISTKSDRDIVNFFTGFILSPDQELRNIDGSVSATNLLSAFHLLGGLEIDVQKVEFNIEPWYKRFNQNIELNRYKRYNADKDFIIEEGNAAGVDVSAKYSTDKLYLWGVVGYQKVTRDDGNQVYPPPFDRRVNVNLVAAYTGGQKKDWEVSARFNYGSPFPFTQTQGFYEQYNFVQHGIGTDYLTQNGDLDILYANDINGGRLSHYHRLDISGKKRFDLSKNSNIETTLSITNVYNRKNVFYVNRIENVVYYQLPIFPSLNVTWNF